MPLCLRLAKVLKGTRGNVKGHENVKGLLIIVLERNFGTCRAINS